MRSAQRDEVPVRKRRRSLPGDCSGWKMAGAIFLTVTRGDGSRLSDQQGVRTVGRRGLMGRDDGAGLVRYANSSVNLKVLLLTG
jgi:hypothetical protein